ncbi:MAG: hypothetical protein AB7N65_02375 [Vicinamibacterales bacterium]
MQPKSASDDLKLPTILLIAQYWRRICAAGKRPAEPRAEWATAAAA